MRRLSRIVAVAGLLSLAGTPSLKAQVGDDSFKWYFGGQIGLMVFETQSQTRGTAFTAGGHVLITAKRAGLILAVEEGIKTNQVSSYVDPSVAGGRRTVIFNDLRRYSATLVAFPFKSHAQPYLGVGVGILQTVKEYPQGTFATPAEADNATQTADQLGSFGFGSLVGGIQFRLDRFAAFGQYQITSQPGSGKLFVGSTHSIMGGLRISLGSARSSGAGTY